ncbi:MAG: hypothetical protein KatS3mg051_0226 [Anaerolineae bacterium]|nr:MAG: hypothetical protein KatS3mg051_0226 [Anaerolineae bacterium]
MHRLTGVAPSVAIHIPWDKTDDWVALRQYAADLGLRIGAVNPNLFQEEQYKLGSLCSPDPKARESALAHMAECCQIMQQVGSDILSVWLADGTNYAGQDSLRERKHRLEEGLAATYKLLPPGSRMLVEYKFFEPAFYSTDLPDWGTSYAMCLKLGPQAEVLVDTGHHAHGTNIAQIVAFLLDEGRLGGFHFNARKYADDDLIVGSQDPFELFTIFVELVGAGERASRVAYMIDQSHNIEPKIEAMIQSVVNCQVAYAKALLVDFKRLAEAQLAGDVLGAHRVCSKPMKPTCARCWPKSARRWGCIQTPSPHTAPAATPSASPKSAAPRGRAARAIPAPRSWRSPNCLWLGRCGAPALVSEVTA